MASVGLTLYQNLAAFAGRFHRVLAELPIRLSRSSTDEFLHAGYIASCQDSPWLDSFPRDARPAASTELLTCIADLERTSTDLRNILMRTSGEVGRSIREYHYELEAVIHRLARSVRS